MKLNTLAFALTCGILWGLGLFVLTWWMILTGGATGEQTIIGRIYLGYRIDSAGSFIGLIWALADGFIGGLIFAWLYNLLSVKLKKKK